MWSDGIFGSPIVEALGGMTGFTNPNVDPLGGRFSNPIVDLLGAMEFSNPYCEPSWLDQIQ